MSATPRSLYQSHESIMDENGSFVKQVSNKKAQNYKLGLFIG